MAYVRTHSKDSYFCKENKYLKQWKILQAMFYLIHFYIICWIAKLNSIFKLEKLLSCYIASHISRMNHLYPNKYLTFFLFSFPNRIFSLKGQHICNQTIQACDFLWPDTHAEQK